jgi:hypothetical protein
LTNYRLYRLDGTGRITAAEWIEAADDEDARRQAATRAEALSFELWDKNRLVDRFRASGQSPAA